jgi:hypothetical protein
MEVRVIGHILWVVLKWLLIVVGSYLLIGGILFKLWVAKAPVKVWNHDPDDVRVRNPLSVLKVEDVNAYEAVEDICLLFMAFWSILLVIAIGKGIAGVGRFVGGGGDRFVDWMCRPTKRIAYVTTKLEGKEGQ